MSTCETGNYYDGRIGVRISAIFVIGFGSFLGTWFPVFASRHRGVGVPNWAFFIAKYFGSGVIVATAFIHLLAPANEALTDPCLTGPITEYPWVEGISLMSVFALFFVELITMRYANFGHEHSAESVTHPHDDTPESKSFRDASNQDSEEIVPARSRSIDPIPDGGDAGTHGILDSYAAQMTGVFILEFGVIFHSIFIGLTLAVSGEEFNTLYVVLVFHQTFEGLALGSRFASIAWPRSKRWTPYALGAGYALSTPIAIAIGLGIRQSYHPGSQTALITNGVFDSISAGILIYTGLVELMAHDFMFSSYMQRAPISEVLYAFGTMCLGAGLMALLGKWA